MKKYQVFYRFDGDMEVEANSEEEAREIAEDKAFRDSQFNSTLEICHIHEYKRILRRKNGEKNESD